MVGTDFKYCGVSLSDFEMIMAKPDDNDTFGLSREFVKGEITPYKSSPLHFNTLYQDAQILNFFIIKNQCKVGERYTIDTHELRHITAWLTSSKLPKTLVVENNISEQFEFDGIFTTIEPFDTGKLNGLYLEFTCDAPYGYERQAIIKDISDEKVSFNAFCSSDELEECVYPLITIKCNDSVTQITGFYSFEINGEEFSIDLDDSYNEVIIDSKLKRVLAKKTENGQFKPLSYHDIGMIYEKEILQGTYKIANPRLLPGNNTVSFSGKGTIKMEWKSPMKVGAWIDDV